MSEWWLKYEWLKMNDKSTINEWGMWNEWWINDGWMNEWMNDE